MILRGIPGTESTMMQARVYIFSVRKSFAYSKGATEGRNREILTSKNFWQQGALIDTCALRMCLLYDANADSNRISFDRANRSLPEWEGDLPHGEGVRECQR